MPEPKGKYRTGSLKLPDLPREKIAVLPPGVEHDPGPSRELKQAMRGQRPCGDGKVLISLDSGPRRSRPITLFCAKPDCLLTGECTGPRFVPHVEQWTTTDLESPRRKRWYVTEPSEIVAAVRKAADKVFSRTGRRDDREPFDIVTFVMSVQQGIVDSMKKGDWTL